MIPFAEHSQLVEHHLRDRYGIAIVVRDIPDPLTGDLNGAEIHIDYAVTPEQRLFLLAHLFGHTVQWNSQPHAFDLGMPQHPPVPESLMPALLRYEKDAASYALNMLHELGITGIDQWFSDYSACDVAYLHNFYRTGEKRDFETFWRDGTPRLAPLPIPLFQLTKQSWRSDGIVI